MAGTRNLGGGSYYQMLLAKNNIVLKKKYDYEINVKEVNDTVAKIDVSAIDLRKQITSDIDEMDRQENRVLPERYTAFDKFGRRICCICKQAKAPNEYPPNKQKIDGRDARCKRCKSIQVMAYRKRK